MDRTRREETGGRTEVGRREQEEETEGRKDEEEGIRKEEEGGQR